MAYISVVSKTESSIRVQMRGLDISYAGSDRVCTWYLNGSRKGTSNLGGKISAGGTFTFSGLKAGTSYTISVSITAPGWTKSVNLDTTAETESKSVAPWSWSQSNGNASAAQTQKAYSAITSKGSTGDFSYLVWNDLVDKVNELVVASSGGWNSDYANLSATKMNSSIKEMTATRFNSLRHNMAKYRTFSSWIPIVSRGDTVYGSYFVNIVNEINSWVNSL